MVANPKLAELMDSQNKGGWTLISARSRVRNLLLAPEVPLHNRYDALGLKKGEGVNNNNGNGQDSGKSNCMKVDQQTSCIRTSATKKAWRVLDIGDFSLRSTEVPIFHPDNIKKEVFCLSGACIRDITKRLPGLVKSEGYHPFPLFHVRTTEAATRRLRNIKRDFIFLWKDAEEIRSTSRVLLSPPSWRLGPKEEAAYGSGE